MAALFMNIGDSQRTIEIRSPKFGNYDICHLNLTAAPGDLRKVPQKTHRRRHAS
jgi:hypothetical protein